MFYPRCQVWIKISLDKEGLGVVDVECDKVELLFVDLQFYEFHMKQIRWERA